MTTLQTLPLLPIHPSSPTPSQPTGKWRWLVTSVVSFVGSSGVGYISVKSFIAKAVVEGGILGAGSLVCAGACVYCAIRFYNALTTRTVESITSVNDEMDTTMILRPFHDRLSRLINPSAVNGLELRVEDRGLPEAINRQLTELEKSQTHQLKSITVMDVSSDNVLSLQTIETRLKIALNAEPEDGATVQQSIGQLLAYLEEILPKMNQQLLELQEAIQNVMQNRFTQSQNTTGPNSPSADSSRETDLFARLNALDKQLKKDQVSRTSSRLSSVYSSPISGNPTPVRASTRTKEQPPQFRIDAAVTDSDAEEGK